MPLFYHMFCLFSTVVTIKEYVRGKKMDLDEKATVRFETMPGKQGQMDWGFFEDHQVYEDGKWLGSSITLWQT